MSDIDIDCKICGRKITWFNDIPLKGYCWGTEEKEHKEYKILVNSANRDCSYPQIAKSKGG